MTVCPALLPPWLRTTMSALAVSTSMIFPFPSSPHCAPTRIVFAIEIENGQKFSRCIRPDTLGTADKEYVTARRLQGILLLSMFRSLAAAVTDRDKNKHPTH